MGRPDFEDLEVYKLAETLANEIWYIVKAREYFDKDKVGRQIVRAADSICVNIAEGRDRYNYQNERRSIEIARGSSSETIALLRLAYIRQPLTTKQVIKLKPIVDELPPKLNAYLKSKDNN